MFNPNERIIGAAYVMQRNILNNIFTQIQSLMPEDENISKEEIAVSVLLEPNNLSENDKRERIIGAATVMNKDDACKVWNSIIQLISIPEVTPEEAAEKWPGNLN